jgi:hypothetical protein
MLDRCHAAGSTSPAAKFASPGHRRDPFRSAWRAIADAYAGSSATHGWQPMPGRRIPAVRQALCSAGTSIVILSASWVRPRPAQLGDCQQALVAEPRSLGVMARRPPGGRAGLEPGVTGARRCPGPRGDRSRWQGASRDLELVFRGDFRLRILPRAREVRAEDRRLESPGRVAEASFEVRTRYAAAWADKISNRAAHWTSSASNRSARLY